MSWYIIKTERDFEVKYTNFTPAPTTEKEKVQLEHVPGLGMQEKVQNEDM
jgi:hypothetical protein